MPAVPVTDASCISESVSVCVYASENQLPYGVPQR